MECSVSVRRVLRSIWYEWALGVVKNAFRNELARVGIGVELKLCFESNEVFEREREVDICGFKRFRLHGVFWFYVTDINEYATLFRRE